MKYLTAKTTSPHVTTHKVESKLRLAKSSEQLIFIQIAFLMLFTFLFGLTSSAHALEVWAADAMTK